MSENASSTAGLAGFAKMVIRASFEGLSYDPEDLQDLARKHGLLVEEAFDPKIHKDETGFAKPGDPWLVFAGPLAGNFPDPLAHMRD